MKIIEDNPYRLLGVFLNSPKRERVANQAKLKAFLKVGQSVGYPLDLPGLLPSINRTEELVADAESKLTLQADQLKYAQFWFLSETSVDDDAFAQLYDGKVDEAVKIWAETDNASSLQNRIVCFLTQNNFRGAIFCAEILYSQYIEAFVHLVAGDFVPSENIANNLLDGLCEEVGAETLLPYVTNEEWRNYLASRSTGPIISQINDAVEIAKASRNDGPESCLTAGNKLMHDCDGPIKQLAELMDVSAVQYQMIADKLSNEVLQCAIDYVNDSKDPEAPRKAIDLVYYALSTAKSKMATDRCLENLDTLNKMIDQIPPASVLDKEKAIRDELEKYNQLPKLISHAVDLLNNTRPLLLAIKNELGETDSYYLRISTLVVSNALTNIIAEVNEKRKICDDIIEQIKEGPEYSGEKVELEPSPFGDNYENLNFARIDYRSALSAAWDAIIQMEAFDMETEFKISQYYKNRYTLQDICVDMGVISRSSLPESSTSDDDDSNTNWRGVIGLIALIIIFMCRFCN